MTVQKLVLVFAGSMVLASSLLAWFVHPGFVWVSVFVGANLLQSVFTGFCPLAMLLRKAGVSDQAVPVWQR
jgi:hypothetical protein